MKCVRNCLKLFALLDVLTRLDRSIKHEFNATVTFLIADDEKGYGITDDSGRAYCHREGIRLQIEHHTLRNRTDPPNAQART
jgi:hypothetical protein